MSSISGVSGNDSQLYLYQSYQSAILAGDSTDPTADAPSDSNNAILPAPATQPSAAGGFSGTDLSSLRSQLQTAVSDAIKSVGSTGSPGDILSAIKGAVDKTLEANGLDPKQFQGVHHGHGHHPSHGAEGAPAAGASGSDPDGDGDCDATGATESQSGASTTAATSTATGKIDLAEILKNLFSQFPTGSGVNVLA